mgnify:FL=1
MKALSIFLILALFSSGCAQSYAIGAAPPKKCVDDVLMPGVDRALVMGCFGPAVSTRNIEDKLDDTFLWEEGPPGNALGWKIARVVLYTAADVFTIFLAQIITWPIEMAAFGEDEYITIVTYDEESSKWIVDSSATHEKD